MLFKINYKDWEIHFSNSIVNSPNYIKTEIQRKWLQGNGMSETDLHLAVSVRSFRSETSIRICARIIRIKL